MALKQNVSEGDRVIIVGGGLGVTAAFAALSCSPTGTVICYEGSSAGLGAIERTSRANGVSSRLTVVNRIVGESIGVYGDAVSVDPIDPTALPSCDILELDCEGSELGILDRMIIRPRVIAVETHGTLGSPSSQVRSRLETMGYNVSDLGVAEPRLKELCERIDIHVLIGHSTTLNARVL